MRGILALLIKNWNARRLPEAALPHPLTPETRT